MKHRDLLLDANFSQRLKDSLLPDCSRNFAQISELVNEQDLIDLFLSQLYCRHVDLIARSLRREGKGFYTISSAGHEGNCVISKFTRPGDPAFLHYRSTAFQIQRARSQGEDNFLCDLLLSLRASSKDPISGGRHKVLGSRKLWIPPQTSTVASHLPKAVGFARSIPLGKKLQLKCEVPEDSMVICSFGDASFNHSTAQGALNLASWLAYQSIPLPILFLCEDNGLGISVPTPQGWIETAASRFPAITFLSCDGLCLIDLIATVKDAVEMVRRKRKPVFLQMKTVRLLAHAGSDIESVYRSEDQIESEEARDPLLHTAQVLITNKILPKNEILDLYERVREEVQEANRRVEDAPLLQTAQEVMEPLIPLKCTRESPFHFKKQTVDSKLQPLGKLLNQVLHETLDSVPESVVFGEDVGLKGGVYNVTSGLQKRFSKRRVFDSLLDEQSILGFAIGLSQNGFLPIPEIQFLAYLHNAEDQLRGEAATLSFFSNSQFTNPMVLRLPSLAYQKGFGGHFHNDNSLAVLRDIPGLLIACPSNGADAVRLFRSCVRMAYEQHRVVIFLEPIALYHTRDLFKEGDQLWSHSYPPQGEECPPGTCQIHGVGEDLCILSYGNGVYLSIQAQGDLLKKGIKARIVDLLWLSPLDIPAILRAIGKSKRILLVDECRKTGSLSEELFTRLMEESPEELKVSRITGMDSFIPLGDASSLVLLSREDILREGLMLLERS